MARRIKIEFVGLPGIGKTSVMHSLINTECHTQEKPLHILDYKIFIANRNALQKIGITIFSIITNWRIFILLIKYIYCNGARSIFQFRLVGSFMRLIKDIEKVESKANTNENIIFEEGFCQLLTALVVPGRGKPYLLCDEKILEFIISQINCFVLFTPDTSLSIDRILKRDSNLSRFDKWNDASTKMRNLELFKNVLLKIIDQIKSLGGNVLLVDSSLEIEEKSKLISCWISNLNS